MSVYLAMRIFKIHITNSLSGDANCEEILSQKAEEQLVGQRKEDVESKPKYYDIFIFREKTSNFG